MKFNTIDEIVNDIMIGMDPDDVMFLLETPRKDMIQFHHGQGTNIRNYYGLWRDNPLTEKWRIDESSRVFRDGIDYSPDHPDAVSMDILYTLWDRVNNV